MFLFVCFALAEYVINGAVYNFDYVWTSTRGSEQFKNTHTRRFLLQLYEQKKFADILRQEKSSLIAHNGPCGSTRV